MNNFSPISPPSWMECALEEAQQALEKGEVPVGALIVDRAENKIISQAHNQVEALKNPLAHAEMLVLEDALQKKSKEELSSCDLYVTLEPCPMCAQAISFSRVGRVFFGAYNPKAGGVDHGPHIFESSSCFHKPEIVGGLLERKCQRLLKDFFSNLR